MKSLVLIGVLLIIFGYLIFGIRWSSYWVIKTSCFAPIELHIKNVFSAQATSSWHSELPKKGEELNWEGPAIYHFLDDDGLELTHKGIAGHLMGQFDVVEAEPMSLDAKVKITGDVYILKNSIFVELMNSSKQSISILGEVKGEKRLISTLYMSDMLLNTLYASKCVK